MAGKIPVDYAYEPRVNVICVNGYENVDFEEIMLTCLWPRYQ